MGWCERLHGVGAGLPEVSIQRGRVHIAFPHLPSVRVGWGSLTQLQGQGRQPLPREKGFGEGGQVLDQVGQQVGLELL